MQLPLWQRDRKTNPYEFSVLVQIFWRDSIALHDKHIELLFTHKHWSVYCTWTEAQLNLHDAREQTSLVLAEAHNHKLYNLFINEETRQSFSCVE